ncbi:MAG: hypothetical protein EWV78_08720 [Microcystis aeruginosa Ma_MB_F_20061100_S20D]|uniref:Glycosyltransferase RgtA/B/C/D-like domain-containing protein n=1 Tax=Microcystis aeruginosa Ma_MB_F_20061100_S20D TaxID=2486253 RepID=A0A552EPY3_MICAE|nr:MAG: hypothetical protein EWV78_08720 [Microcystis aeruginosa Ma_MB_F_20061100_S20D]
MAARWPGFLPPMLNSDEAQFTAGAIKLLKDPVFWRAVDTGSSGPLNVYPLTLPAFFGFRIEYASSRVIGLIMIIAAIVCLYYALSILYDKSLSRLAIVPVVTTVALMKFFDYVHYTSEHFSVAILSVALLIVCKYYAGNLSNPNRLIFALGFILGLTPFAKMQSVPIAFSIACIFLHILWLKSSARGQFIRSLAAFFLGGILFSALVILYLTIFSIHDAFWKSYIQQNLLIYSTHGLMGNLNQMSFFRKINIFIRMLRRVSDTRILFLLTAIVLILGFPFLIIKRFSLSLNQEKSNTFCFVYYSLFILVASSYSIIKPGNGFSHYLLFLIIPSGFLIGVFMGELAKVLQVSQLTLLNLRFFLLTGVIFITVASSFLEVARTIKSDNVYLNNRRRFARNYLSPIAKTILKYASPGESMAVWGWASELYVDTGLVTATIDSVSPWQILPGSLQEYFLKRYADDLINSNAKLFVDAVAPRMFFFTDRKTQGHEVFPEIARVIKENYRLVDEVQGVRIYLKK